jgi:hypothetical protein
MLIKTLIPFVLLFCSNAFSYNGEIDKFFELYEAGKINQAVDSIYSTGRWIDPKGDEVLHLKSQLNSFVDLVGKYQGKTRLGESDLGSHMTYVSYLALYERQPVRLEFMFYKSKDKWMIYSFSFDDSIDEEFKNFARKKIVGYK